MLGDSPFKNTDEISKKLLGNSIQKEKSHFGHPLEAGGHEDECQVQSERIPGYGEEGEEDGEEGEGERGDGEEGEEEFSSRD